MSALAAIRLASPARCRAAAEQRRRHASVMWARRTVASGALAKPMSCGARARDGQRIAVLAGAAARWLSVRFTEATKPCWRTTSDLDTARAFSVLTCSSRSTDWRFAKRFAPSPCGLARQQLKIRQRPSACSARVAASRAVRCFASGPPPPRAIAGFCPTGPARAGAGAAVCWVTCDFPMLLSRQRPRSRPATLADRHSPLRQRACLGDAAAGGLQVAVAVDGGCD